LLESLLRFDGAFDGPDHERRDFAFAVHRLPDAEIRRLEHDVFTRFLILVAHVAAPVLVGHVPVLGHNDSLGMIGAGFVLSGLFVFQLSSSCLLFRFADHGLVVRPAPSKAVIGVFRARFLSGVSNLLFRANGRLSHRGAWCEQKN
jgi:hypothetical protein